MADIENKRIGLIGSGSWATALAKLLNKNLPHFIWWVKDERVKKHLTHHHNNPSYLSDVAFNISKIDITTDINHLVNSCDIIFIVVPSIYIIDCLNKLKKSIEDKIIVISIKGIIPDYNQSVGDYLLKKLNLPIHHLAVISGPCHAEEVALERLSYLTVASDDIDVAKTIAQYLRCDFIRVKESKDVLGIEYAAILKNIYAIAAGIAHGLGYGDNFQAVLMSNSIREMNYILEKIEKAKRQISESAYLGDLLVTGYSPFSRNRMFGNMIGKGHTVKTAIMEMNMVAEGYYATKGLRVINEEHGIKAPIIEAVYDILYSEKNTAKVFKKLSEKIN